MSLNYFYSIVYIQMTNSFETLTARVEKKFPVVIKKMKDGSDFPTQKVLVTFDEESEFPSKIVLEQAGEKKIKVSEEMVEGAVYDLSMNYRANVWTDPNGNETAFGSISAWRADLVEEAKKAPEDLPFN